MVSELMPRLPKLQSIQLPYSILSENPELTKNIIEDFASREEPIVLYEDGEDDVYYWCLFRQIWVNTLDDSPACHIEYIATNNF